MAGGGTSQRRAARHLFNICINARHDAQQGGLTGTVKAQYADFCAREEAQRDVFKNMTFRRNDFADTMHGINELGHVGLASVFIVMDIPVILQAACAFAALVHPSHLLM